MILDVTSVETIVFYNHETSYTPHFRWNRCLSSCDICNLALSMYVGSRGSINIQSVNGNIVVQRYNHIHSNLV